MNQEQLAAAYERAQREITTPQQQPVNENNGNATREYDPSGLDGTSLGRVAPVREPFNNAAHGQQPSNDAPKTPELELRPPAPAPSPPGMGGPPLPNAPMTFANTQEVQERVDVMQAWRDEQEQGKPETSTALDSPDRSEMPAQQGMTAEQIKALAEAQFGDGPTTQSEVDVRVADIKEMQAKHDATKDAQEWANGIKAMEQKNEGLEHSPDRDIN